MSIKVTYEPLTSPVGPVIDRSQPQESQRAVDTLRQALHSFTFTSPNGTAFSTGSQQHRSRITVAQGRWYTEVRNVQLHKRCSTKSLHRHRHALTELCNNNLRPFNTLHTPSEIPSNKSAS